MSSARGESASPATQTPWLTYLLLALLAVTFQAAAVSSRSIESSNQEDLDEAAEYFHAHPYLEAGPELALRLGDALDRERSRFESERERRGAIPIPAGIQRRQQESLDELLAEAVSARDEDPARAWGLIPSAPRPGSFLSYVFLHSGWVHLLGNLFLLCILGVYLESVFGALLFAGVLALGSVLAGAVGVMSVPQMKLPLIGATGLVAVLLGVFAIRFATRADAAYAFVMVIGLAWLGVPLWLDLHWSVTEASAEADLALAARGCLAMAIGGVGFGVIASPLLSIFGVERALSGTPGGAGSARVSSARLGRALDAQARGQGQEAFDLLTRALDEQPSSPDVALALWDVATSLGRSAEAAGAMLRVLRDDVSRDDGQAVVDHWLELDERGLSADADLTLLIRVAAILRREGQPSAALGALQLALSQAERVGSPIVASRVARAAKDLDPDTAEDAAWKALGSVDLGYEERQGLEEMLGELHRARDLGETTGERTHSYGQADPRERAAPVDLDVPGVEASPEPEEVPLRPQPIDLDDDVRQLELSVVVPLALEDGGLRVELASGQKALLRLHRIDAIAVVAVQGLAAKPVILIDLVINWMSLRHEPLKVVRLRGDRFDPHQLCPGHASAVEAVRDFTGRLLEHTGAHPLPDADAAHGRPFAVLADLHTYQRDVLMADDTSEAG